MLDLLAAEMGMKLTQARTDAIARCFQCGNDITHINSNGMSSEPRDNVRQNRAWESVLGMWERFIYCLDKVGRWLVYCCCV